jgi:hypothetical protein
MRGLGKALGGGFGLTRGFLSDSMRSYNRVHGAVRILLFPRHKADTVLTDCYGMRTAGIALGEPQGGAWQGRRPASEAAGAANVEWPLFARRCLRLQLH